jgi:hypothetical protein
MKQHKIPQHITNIFHLIAEARTDNRKWEELKDRINARRVEKAREKERLSKLIYLNSKK